MRRLLWRSGYELEPRSLKQDQLLPRWRNELRIDLVLDVGANAGQYADRVRRWGYAGRLISVEPQAAAFADLKRNMREDAHWRGLNVALGATRGRLPMQISANSVSSSFYSATEAHAQAGRGVTEVGTETVDVLPLDGIADDWLQTAQRIWMKLDVQGFEAEVLSGATQVLNRCVAVECELSLSPMYKGGADYVAVIQQLASIGLRLCFMQPALQDPVRGQWLQVDAVFLR